MSIEDDVFKRYLPDFNKLKQYGFREINNIFTIETLFKNDLFKAVVKIKSDGNITGKVFDLENNDEFLPLRAKNNQGAFTAEVKLLYEELLKDIRDNCFIKEYFIYPQANRITNLIIKKYGDKPEFLWKSTPGTGVFRNKNTNKWYLAILDIDNSKIQADKSGIIEIADIKLAPENIEELIKEKHFYPGYHMNKKYWITIILNDSIPDKKIMELIEESYNFSKKKN